ncbi:16S rRNA (uracil(1498)-N(3))-methyltransferase [Alkalicoccus luteus]|uniref:Ribosomal RNA small subunit methyltransferase E n=1 Tax=Alkalicoccus luteus TaxID=1237094 RepID=A0A969TU13_9BACI|nr:16S rRNA (uracil(1498)-N(3))-methyltransferase [Alkalicoccus luteus]NJP36501.1 16S rRNA (uracil(1498)-N(3))-methyltransferase [Alkalicoccus luteus]
MQRYFLEEQQIQGDTVEFDKDSERHIRTVMRMQRGDEVIVCVSGSCHIVTLEEGEPLRAVIREKETADREMPVQVTVAQALVKADKLELVLQKGTELGAAAFIPFQAERSIVKTDPKKQDKKLPRWKKIVKEAAEQSGRRLVPAVFNPIGTDNLIRRFGEFDLVLAAYEEQAKIGDKRAFFEAVNELGEGKSVLIIVGPEGGLSAGEAERLSRSGAVMCGLGPRILRTETAPLYMLSALSYHTELSR